MSGEKNRPHFSGAWGGCGDKLIRGGEAASLNFGDSADIDGAGVEVGCFRASHVGASAKCPAYVVPLSQEY